MQADLVVLAAGEGRRAGGPKAWIQVAGRPWLSHQLQALSRAPVGRLMVVLAAPPPEAFAELLPEENWALNPQPELGPFHSLQCGLRALGVPRAVPGVFVLPVDVPAPSPEVFEALSRALPGAPAAVPEFEGRGGHPVLLSGESANLLLKVDPAAPVARLDRWLREAHARRVPVLDARVRMDLNSSLDFGGLTGVS